MDLKQSENQRYLEAEKDITDAFFRMLEQMPFEDITVSALIQRSGVNRSTFYRHFQDKYDILEKMQEAAEPITRELMRAGQEENAGRLLDFLLHAPLDAILSEESRHRFLVLLSVKTARFDLKDFLLEHLQRLYEAPDDGGTERLERELFADILFRILCARMEGREENAGHAIKNVCARLMSDGMGDLGRSNKIY